MVYKLVGSHAVAAFQAANQIKPLLNSLVAHRIEILLFDHLAQINAHFFGLIVC